MDHRHRSDRPRGWPGEDTAGWVVAGEPVHPGSGPGYPNPGPPNPGYPAQPVEPEATSWLPALLWTMGLFLVPVLLYLGWTLTLSDAAPAGCLDATGGPCPPPRTEAVRQLAGVLPGLGGALALALLVALGLRRVTTEWRDLTVGFAAAVIGAGLATLVAAIAG